jgi:hypothetical protein
MAEQEDNVPGVLPYSTGPMASASAVVWCRLLAVVMLGWGAQTAIVALAQLVDFLPRSSFNASTIVEYGIGLALPTIVWLILGWYCWAKAPVIANRMARDRAEQNLSPHGMNPDELLATLTMGIGIYMLANGLPTVAQYSYDVFGRVRNGLGPFTNYYGGIVGAVIRCALGLWLILRTRGIVTIIRRHSGRWRDTTTPPQQNI